jgi:very-short-patch-repair endonuclease
MTTIINNIAKKEKRRGLRRKQTAEELKLWKLVRDNRLGVKFRRQVSIGPYIADFYCREKQLVIELDGLHHIENKDYDSGREKYFISLGIKTIRFWNYEINNDIQLVKNKIIQTIKNVIPLSDPLRVNY